jgi:8-oxo-dGTP diphosphatase
MRDFVGTKVALLNKDKILVILRDDKPNISFPGMWDLPGGQREGRETPREVATREIKEELGIDISNNEVLWQGYFPAVADPSKEAAFLVVNIVDNQLLNIVFGDEGQKWEFMKTDEFIRHNNVVKGMQDRLKAYLDSNSPKLLS